MVDVREIFSGLIVMFVKHRVELMSWNLEMEDIK